MKDMKEQPLSIPAWSARISDLPPDGRGVEIDANAAEREAIAAAYGVLRIDRFLARLLLQPAGDGGVRLSGRLSVSLAQRCVVSLRPVEQRIDEEFVRAFLPAERLDASRHGLRSGKAEILVGLDEEEPPEPLKGGMIDLSAVLLEQFAVALDPYPRHPDAVLGKASEPADTQEKDSPFAVLRSLQERDRK